jgi:alpha-glucosidase (family GH31 glycosyl hydrolase)
MFVRSGAVIPTQASRLTIKEARTTPFTLVAALGAGASHVASYLFKPRPGDCTPTYLANPM